MEKPLLEKARQWLIGNFDADTKSEIRRMLEEDEQTLVDSFYKDLKFGTGGLRGKLGVGTNRMNIYTVGRATQGLANYLKKSFADKDTIKVAIAHDSRHNSRLFAETAANILSANDIEVYLFEDLRPTPELSFATRHLKCQAGIVITASHNPKEYNGYKVYWEDGAQIISPHDKNILAEMQKIDYDKITFTGKHELIHIIGEEIDRAYINEALKISLNPELIKKHSDIKIVYTPLHGTGITLLPKTFEAFGFTNLIIVEEQAKPDGDFPTVKSPNPENPEALQLALEKARAVDADLILATDPDSDRIAVGVKAANGEFILLNGNQIGSILAYYILSNLKIKQRLTGNEFMVKTIVTTDLIKEIAENYGVDLLQTLTGFKYIGALIRELEGKKKFIFGAEESFGYLASDFVRDKDAISSAALIAEVVAWAKENKLSLYELLIEIYTKFNLYLEKLVNIVKEGKQGEEEINSLMEHYRSGNISQIAGHKVVKRYDYLQGKIFNLENGTEESLDFPKSNVIQFRLEDGSLISIRPSGTEPKIKYYFSVKTKLESAEIFENKKKELESKIDELKNELTGK